MKTFCIALPEDEIHLLDGITKCPKVQAHIDSVKSRQAIESTYPVGQAEANFLNRVAEYARKELRLYYSTVPYLTSCDICQTKESYWPHTRSSRSHRKGDPDYGNPKKFRGFDLGKRSVTIEGRANLGGCVPCFEKLKASILLVVAGMEIELPPILLGGKASPFIADEVVECLKCGHQCLDRERLPLSALISGWFPGKCPKCGAESGLFREEVWKRTGRREVKRIAVPVG